MNVPPHRFVIVGAGLAGATTAYHLRAAGMRDVVILEREAVADVHASGRNAAMLRTAMDDPRLQALADESTARLRAGDLAPFHVTGGFLLGAGDEAAAAHLPWARGRGRFVATDGVMDVAALLQRFLHGAEVRYGCAVQGFEARADGIHVETTTGPLRADVLVNAAGAWAGTLGGLPLTPRARTLFVSAVDPMIDPAWPFLWDLEHHYYLRPESGGWLLCPCDERDGEPGVYVEDEEVLLDLGRKLRTHQPGLGDLRIARSWVGQRTFAPDRLPILGFDPVTPGLFHVAGLGGHGVTLSWAIGRLAATALLAGPHAADGLVPEALSARRLQAS